MPNGGEPPMTIEALCYRRVPLAENEKPTKPKKTKKRPGPAIPYPPTPGQ